MTPFYFQGSLHYGGRLARALIQGDRIPWLATAWRKEQGRRYRYTLEALLASAINAHLQPDTEGWVIIARKDCDYQQSRIYGDYSISATRNIMDAAAAAGYFEVRLGYKAHGDYTTGRRTIYRGTQLLWDLLESSTPGWQKLPQIDSKIGKSWVREQSSRKILVHEDPAAEAKLNTINTAAQAHTWTNLPTPQYFQVQIHNGVENCGGRIYTAAQNTPKINRPDWQVNGESVAEIDIAACHINILYSIVGATPPPNPYNVGGPPSRELYKLILNNLINAATAQSAGLSILKEISTAPTGSPLHLSATAELTTYNNTQPTTTPTPYVRGRDANGFTKPFVQWCMDQARAFHNEISTYFGSGFGLRAMGIEGEIAMEVLLHCARLNIPCINIHDGFVTNISNVANVQAIVQQVLLRRGIPASTKIKGLSTSAPAPQSAHPKGPASPIRAVSTPQPPPHSPEPTRGPTGLRAQDLDLEPGPPPHWRPLRINIV